MQIKIFNAGGYATLERLVNEFLNELTDPSSQLRQIIYSDTATDCSVVIVYYPNRGIPDLNDDY